MEQFFWLLCGVWCGLIGSGFFWNRLRKHSSSGSFTDAEVTSFAIRIALWIFLPCLALWLLQMSITGVHVGPEYPTWPAPQRYAAFAIQFFVWFALLYWVFFRGGANALSKYGGATSPSMPTWFRSPIMAKLVAVLVVAAGIGALLGRGT